MIVPANIVVTIIAAYNGDHRVCYRTGNVGSYTCLTISCAGGSTPCVATVPIFVDNETCNVVQFNGYVQPVCMDIASTDERVPFSETFTPTPSCNSYTLTCQNSGVGSAIVTNGATDYDPLNPPSILFTGGGGTGVTGSAEIGAGSILTSPITTPGSGYTNGVFPNVNLTGGAGTGAQATVTVTGGVITSVVISNVGTGYGNSQILGFNYVDMGMGIAPTTEGYVTITSDYGILNGIAIISQGGGYTTPPTITVGVSGGGTQATATAVLATCPAINTTGCNGVVVVIPETVLHVGDSMSICNIGGAPTVDPAYSVVSAGNCLCNGILATIGVSGLVGQQIRYFYNRNGAGVINGILTVGGSPSQVIDCIVPGSLGFQSLSTALGTIVYGGPC